MPRLRIPSISGLLYLGIGLTMGMILAPGRAPTLSAHGNDRSGESILHSGPISVESDVGLKIQVAQDAIYYLDWKAGRLVATIPSRKQMIGSNRVIGGFAERDLIADFKVEPGQTPHFLMTTASLGAAGRDTNAPLFVYEATTRQVAVYQVQFRAVGGSDKPKFDLIEVRSFASAAAPLANDGGFKIPGSE